MSALDTLYAPHDRRPEPLESRTAEQIERRVAHLDFLRATRDRWTGGSVRTPGYAPRGMVIRVAGLVATPF